MITIESPDMARLAAGARVFPKPLRAEIRKGLAATARQAAIASRAKIRSMPVKGDVPYKQAAGLRKDISTAIKVSATISTSRGANVRIYVAQSGALAANNRIRVAELLDAGRPFRHPYFGHWVEGIEDQQPFPYFKKVIAARADAMREVMAASLATAIRETIPNLS